LFKRLNLFVAALVLVIIFLAAEIIIVKNISRYEPEVNVVFAKVRIPENTLIKADMLREKKIGADLAHAQSLHSIRDLAGKTAKVDIEEGEMLLSGKLKKADEMEKIEVSDMNDRLFTVEFKGDQANGWRLKEGQHVDIIFIANEKQAPPAVAAHENEKAGTADEFLDTVQEKRVKRLRNVRIAALIDEKGKLVRNAERTSVPKYVSFEVNSGQDEFLAFAKTNGRLELSVIP